MANHPCHNLSMANPLLNFRLEGDVAAGLRFEEFPNDLRDALKGEIEALGREAFTKVAARVPRKTGRLASQERLRLVEGENYVTAIVDFGGADAQGQDHAKAGALEYGSKGKAVAVRAYERRIDRVFGRALAAPMDRLVKAYNRTPKVAERDFVRGAVQDMRPEIIQRLEAVVARAADDFSSDE